MLGLAPNASPSSKGARMIVHSDYEPEQEKFAVGHYDKGHEAVEVKEKYMITSGAGS
jgi:hypothetical protein